MSEYGGWTGRLLSVDLTRGELHVEESWPWLPQHIGAAGLGLALVWERVPPGAGALEPENLLFLGVGPLTGTWAPCAGRAVAVSLAPAAYPVEHVAQGSVGGRWPAMLKWAGLDGVAITGRAAGPVCLVIHDDEFALADARAAWGQDAFRAQQTLIDIGGDPRAQALAIGPAGEKLARNAILLHGTGHALGQCGFGAVAGSKQLKGIVVRGTGRVRTATALADFAPRLAEIRQRLALMQSVVPASESPASRWRAREGLTWSGGDEAVPIGAIPADDLRRQGLRHCGSDVYMGGLLLPWHVKNVGCTGCVMNCFSAVRGRGLPPDIPEHGEMHCVQGLAAYYRRTRDGQTVSTTSREAAFVGKQLADAFGLNAFELRMLVPLLVQLRFGHGGAYRDGLPAALRAELDGLPWASLDAGGDGGLAFVRALFVLLGAAVPGQDTLGAWCLEGTARAAARLGVYEDLWTGAHGQFSGFEGFRVAYAAHGQRDHYGPDRYGLATGLHWAVWNRDPNRHELNGLTSWSGLTWEQKRRVAERLFGDPGVIDDPGARWRPAPVTAGHIELARFLMVRALLKDSLTLCDWVYPNYCCPDPAAEYAGDLGLEAELYRAITGEAASAAELDRRAEALVDLYRACTARDWNTTDLRGAAGYAGGGRGADRGGDGRGHDNLAAWYFTEADVFPDEPAHLDRAEFERAKTLLYERLGWDPVGGGVTRAKLVADGLGDLADGLAALGLLPE